MRSMETSIQIRITGGIGKPKNFPFKEARFFNQLGTTPKTVPPVTVGRETKDLIHLTSPLMYDQS